VRPLNFTVSGHELKIAPTTVAHYCPSRNPEPLGRKDVLGAFLGDFALLTRHGKPPAALCFRPNTSAYDVWGLLSYHLQQTTPHSLSSTARAGVLVRYRILPLPTQPTRLGDWAALLRTVSAGDSIVRGFFRRMCRLLSPSKP
jgi:hypothetical protein